VNFGFLGATLGISTTGKAIPKRSFRYQITGALDELKKHNVTLLITIDEVQNVTSDLKEFITTFQHLIREEYDIMLVMAGLPYAIFDVLNDQVLTFLRRAKRIMLENLPIVQVEVSYSKAFKSSHKQIVGDVLVEAAKATYGYPYLVQLIGYYLWKESDEVVDSEALEIAVKLSKDELYRNVHELIIRELSPKDIEFVYAMAEDELVSNFGDIIARLGITSGYASIYRKRLIDAGVIHSSGYGKLAFSPPYLRDYLLDNEEWIKAFHS
jgi:hypothetical protein